MARLSVVKTSYGGDGSDPVRYFRGKVRKIEEGSSEALEQAVEDGAEIMKDLISQRGTGKTWGGDYGSFRNGEPGRTSSSPGRVASGHMRDQVSSYFNKTGAGNAVGQFGWRTGREDYFGYQEGGFEHANGMTVEGMYAMVDAAELAFRQFERDASKVLRDA